MFRNREMILCPVDGCTQPHRDRVDAIVNSPVTKLRIPFATARHGGVDAAFAEALHEASTASARALEEVLTQHAATHPPIDYLRTIHRLSCELDGYQSGIRPHGPQPDQPPSNPFRLGPVGPPGGLRG